MAATLLHAAAAGPSMCEGQQQQGPGPPIHLDYASALHHAAQREAQQDLLWAAGQAAGRGSQSPHRGAPLQARHRTTACLRTPAAAAATPAGTHLHNARSAHDGWQRPRRKPGAVGHERGHSAPQDDFAHGTALLQPHLVHAWGHKQAGGRAGGRAARGWVGSVLVLQGPKHCPRGWAKTTSHCGGSAGV